MRQRQRERRGVLTLICETSGRPSGHGSLPLADDWGAGTWEAKPRCSAGRAADSSCWRSCLLSISLATTASGSWLIERTRNNTDSTGDTSECCWRRQPFLVIMVCVWKEMRAPRLALTSGSEHTPQRHTGTKPSGRLEPRAKTSSPKSWETRGAYGKQTKKVTKTWLRIQRWLFSGEDLFESSHTLIHKAVWRSEKQHWHDSRTHMLQVRAVCVQEWQDSYLNTIESSFKGRTGSPFRSAEANRFAAFSQYGPQLQLECSSALFFCTGKWNIQTENRFSILVKFSYSSCIFNNFGLFWLTQPFESYRRPILNHLTSSPRFPDDASPTHCEVMGNWKYHFLLKRAERIAGCPNATLLCLPVRSRNL